MRNYLIPDIWVGKADDSPGVGHEFRNWLTGYSIANHYGLKFVHSPFAGSHVVPENKWYTVGRVDIPVEKWEKFLNFGQEEISRQDIPEDIKVIELPSIQCHSSVCHPSLSNTIKQYRNNQIPVLFKCPFNQFLSINWAIYESNILRNKYWNTRKFDPISTPFSENRVSVGIHIRRCDVNPIRYPDRFITTEYYRNVIQQITKVCCDADIHVYSDAASIEEFPELSDVPNIKFHLRTDVFRTFHSLVSSDICVMSHGSWAILVAHLNRGIKITKEWNDAWNKFPSKTDIISANHLGMFNTKILRNKIDQKRQ